LSRSAEDDFLLEANNLEAIKAKSWGLELYFIVLYVILDWFFRQVAFTSLQGIWDELLFITIVGIWIYRSAVEGLRPRGSSILLPILLYGALMLFLFLINSPNDVVALEGIRVMLQYVFWFFLGYNLLFTRMQAKSLVDVFLLACTLVALYGIYQYLSGVEMPAGWVDSTETSITTRVFSIIGSPNILGSLMVLAMPAAFAMYFGSNQAFKKLVYAGLLLVMAACLVLTFSRGALKLTTQKYYTPNGTDINEIGIVPDFVIAENPNGEDVQLSKAIEVLKEKL
jgi:hypothetical protein